jgi:hypothetical protein
MCHFVFVCGPSQNSQKFGPHLLVNTGHDFIKPERVLKSEFIAPSGEFSAWIPKTFQLSFSRPKKMPPKWKIDKDDLIRKCKALFNDIEWAETIDQPILFRMNSI